MIADDKIELKSIPSPPNISFYFILFCLLHVGVTQTDDQTKVMIGNRIKLNSDLTLCCELSLEVNGYKVNAQTLQVKL